MNWKCQKCGKINKGEWCTACGAKRLPVNTGISNNAPRPVPNRANGKQRARAAKKKSSAPVVVLVVLAVLLVLGCAAFAANYFLNNYDERIFSRIVGEYNICKFFGEDLRFKK